MKKRETISQREIQTALNRFLKKGGVIKHLPAQNYNPLHTVGEDKHQIYEAISTFTNLDNSTERSS